MVSLVFKGLLGDLFGRGLRELGKIGKIVRRDRNKFRLGGSVRGCFRSCCGLWKYYIKSIFVIRVVILFLYRVSFFLIGFWLVFRGII